MLRQCALYSYNVHSLKSFGGDVLKWLDKKKIKRWHFFSTSTMFVLSFFCFIQPSNVARRFVDHQQTNIKRNASNKNGKKIRFFMIVSFALVFVPLSMFFFGCVFARIFVFLLAFFRRFSFYSIHFKYIKL